MPEQLTSGIARRVASLATAGAFALGSVVMLAPPAAADDYERTPVEIISQIEARSWPQYSVGNPGPNVDVQAALLFLNGLGYITQNPGCLYNDRAESTVRNFERREGITVNGVLDSTTWVKIRNMHFPTEADAYKRGDRGWGVLAVKVLLNSKYNAGLSLHEYYDAATENAVRNAQRSLGIGVDGAFGRLTYKGTITAPGGSTCQNLPRIAQDERPAADAESEAVERPVREGAPEAAQKPAEKVAPEEAVRETVEEEAPEVAEKSVETPAGETERVRGY
ncbi:peptidoglycan-binding protein [Nocardiopsis alba]|uniref:peptidoglycan-binding domain-containing protein n=1 Tax=Nocardiopsis alba TaxID=53437 RepID=UPI0036734DDA